MHALKGGPYEVQEVFSSICHLLQRSQSPITVLHFDRGSFLTKDLLQLFCTSPTLEDLRLTRLTGFNDEVIERLTVDYGSPEDPVLPRLCTLYIPGGTFGVMCLVRMVQSRRNGNNSRGVNRLQTLRVCGNFQDACPSFDATIPHLQQYFAEGFSFDICRITS